MASFLLPLHLSLLLSISLLLTYTISFSAVAGSTPPPSSAADSTPPPSQEPHEANLLAPILSNLGFQELAMAVPSLTSPINSYLTVFAPSDDSIRTCSSCSASRLLREHLVPGLFSQFYLSNLPFGAKLETSSPGRCLTVTSAGSNSSAGSIKIFVDGVEITRPDLFNDGRIVIHGLQGFVTTLSALSCNQPLNPYPKPSISNQIAADHPGSAIGRLMLRDAVVRLHDGGYSILSLAMRIKSAELGSLKNMTIFALDDPAIFAGGTAFVTNVLFHVVPNRLLMHADLMKLPSGTSLPTLVHGQHLVVTSTNTTARSSGSEFRINYVPIKGRDVVYNTKIVVHSIFLPFPHLYMGDLVSGGTMTTEEDGIFEPPGSRLAEGLKRTCGSSLFSGDCAMAPNAGKASAAGVDFEDDGL